MPRLPDVPRLAPASWAGRGAWKSASRVARRSQSRVAGFGGAHCNGFPGPSPRPRRRPRLPEWALEHLVDVRVGDGLDRLGPGAVHDAPLRGGPRLAVPADLLHVVVELDAVAVRIERERRVVDARIELRRNRVDQRHAA